MVRRMSHYLGTAQGPSPASRREHWIWRKLLDAPSSRYRRTGGPSLRPYPFLRDVTEGQTTASHDLKKKKGPSDMRDAASPRNNPIISGVSGGSGGPPTQVLRLGVGGRVVPHLEGPKYWKIRISVPFPFSTRFPKGNRVLPPRQGLGPTPRGLHT